MASVVDLGVVSLVVFFGRGGFVSSFLRGSVIGFLSGVVGGFLFFFFETV